MELVLAYLAGVLTLINPCVLPVLPIVLASALQASRLGPVVLAAGMGLSFVVLGVALSALGPALGPWPEDVARIGAAVMILFGAVLLIPRLSDAFATATAGVAARADRGIDGIDRRGLGGQFLGGALLGAVWVPCVGPTLGGAIALAAAGEHLAWATAIMAGFAAGIGSVIVALAYGAQSAIRARRDRLRGLARHSRPVMGAIFLLTGLVLLFELHRPVEAWLINSLPYWLQDLSVRY
jgi:cytochrome c-type biogenesis protein